MASARLILDEMMPPDLQAQNSHPMDSSRVLLGLMQLSRNGITGDRSGAEADPLEGVISEGVLRSLLCAALP